MKYWLCSECRKVTEDCKAPCKLITDDDVDLTSVDNTCLWSHYNNLSEVFSDWKEVSDLEFQLGEISKITFIDDALKDVPRISVIRNIFSKKKVSKKKTCRCDVCNNIFEETELKPWDKDLLCPWCYKIRERRRGPIWRG